MANGTTVHRGRNQPRRKMYNHACSRQWPTEDCRRTRKVHDRTCHSERAEGEAKNLPASTLYIAWKEKARSRWFIEPRFLQKVLSISAARPPFAARSLAASAACLFGMTRKPPRTHTSHLLFAPGTGFQRVMRYCLRNLAFRRFLEEQLSGGGYCCAVLDGSPGGSPSLRFLPYGRARPSRAAPILWQNPRKTG